MSAGDLAKKTTTGGGVLNLPKKGGGRLWVPMLFGHLYWCQRLLNLTFLAGPGEGVGLEGSNVGRLHRSKFEPTFLKEEKPPACLVCSGELNQRFFSLKNLGVGGGSEPGWDPFWGPSSKSNPCETDWFLKIILELLMVCFNQFGD